MADTAIEWASKVWNPTTGCDRISPGCDHCYALTMAKRLKAMGQAKYQRDGDPRTSGPGFGLTLHPDALDAPLRWRKPGYVFVNSMSDLGHARVPAEFQARVWAVMALAPRHVFQVLSKRPERLRALLSDGARWPGLLRESLGWLADHADAPMPASVFDAAVSWAESPERAGENVPPLQNVWVGTSIESDAYCRRAGELRATPAAVRFLSLEPLLGPLPSLDLTGIGWVIIGGESGGGARPADLGWFRDLIAQGREAGSAVFVKQLGADLGHRFGAGSHGADWDFWPEDLRIREFPAAAKAAA